MKFASFILVTASLAYLANAASYSKRDDQAKIIETCLTGIKNTDTSAITVTKHFGDLVNGKSDIAPKFEDAAKQAVNNIKKFRLDCIKVSDSYSPEQIAKLIEGLTPLLTSINTLYQDMIDHKKDAKNQEKTIRELVTNVNQALMDFVAWEKKEGSDEVTEKTSETVKKTLELVEKIKETYDIK